MKKSIMFFAVLITLSITVFSFMNWNDSEADQLATLVIEDSTIDTQSKEKINKKIDAGFIYGVGPRFRPITKRDLDNINFFSDYIGEEHSQRIVSYKSLSVIILDGDKKTDVRETSKNGFFTTSQIKLLQSSPYSTNILIWAEYQGKNKITGELEDTHWTPYLTIVPEKQAMFLSGKKTLIRYLNEKSKEVRINVQADKIKPAKLFFTVTKNGTIENVKIDRTSGYPLIDKTMIELITNLSGKWESAKNFKGEKVDQELVISFGTIGC